MYLDLDGSHISHSPPVAYSSRQLDVFVVRNLSSSDKLWRSRAMRKPTRRNSPSDTKQNFRLSKLSSQGLNGIEPEDEKQNSKEIHQQQKHEPRNTMQQQQQQPITRATCTRRDKQPISPHLEIQNSDGTGVETDKSNGKDFDEMHLPDSTEVCTLLQHAYTNNNEVGEDVKVSYNIDSLSEKKEIKHSVNSSSNRIIPAGSNRKGDMNGQNKNCTTSKKIRIITKTDNISMIKSASFPKGNGKEKPDNSGGDLSHWDDAKISRLGTNGCHTSDVSSSFTDDSLNKSLLFLSDMSSHYTFMYPPRPSDDIGRFGTWHPAPPRPTAVISGEVLGCETKHSDSEKMAFPNKEKSSPTSFIAHNIAVYDRLQRLDRNRMFEFHHYPDEPARYMQEYRSVHTVGRVGREDRRGTVLGRDVADPYSYLPCKKLHHGSSSMVKSWQHRLAQEELHRKQAHIQDTQLHQDPHLSWSNSSFNLLNSQLQIEENQPMHYPQQPHDEQQQQQPCKNRQQELQHQYYCEDDEHAVPPHRLFPSLAPTRELTAVNKIVANNKGRIHPSQLSRSKSLCFAKSSWDDRISLPAISARDVQVKTAQHSKETNTKSCRSGNSDINVCSDFQSLNEPNRKNHFAHAHPLDVDLHNKRPYNNDVDAVTSEPDQRQPQDDEQRQTISYLTKSSKEFKGRQVNRKPRPGSKKLRSEEADNMTEECFNPTEFSQTEKGINMTDPCQSESQSTDTLALSQSTVSVSITGCPSLLTENDLYLQKVWRNPHEFERKYCPQKDRTMLSTRSLRSNNDDDEIEYLRENERGSMIIDHEGKSCPNREKDYSQLIIEVSNFRLVSPPCFTSANVRVTDALKISQAEPDDKHKSLCSPYVAPSLMPQGKGKGKRDISDGKCKEKYDIPNGNKTKRTRLYHQCSRFPTRAQRMDFDGACRFHAKDHGQEINHEYNANYRLEYSTRDAKATLPNVDKTDVIAGSDPAVPTRQNYTLELRGTEYKHWADSKETSKRNMHCVPQKAQPISVKSSIDAVSRCNGTEDLSPSYRANPTLENKQTTNMSLSACLQTISRGKPSNIGEYRHCGEHEEKSLAFHDVKAVSGTCNDPSAIVSSSKPPSHQLEDWKNIVDAGQCGFTVRAIPITTGSGNNQLARYTKTSKSDEQTLHTSLQLVDSPGGDLEEGQSQKYIIAENLQKQKLGLQLEIIGCVPSPLGLCSVRREKKWQTAVPPAQSKNVAIVSDTTQVKEESSLLEKPKGGEPRSRLTGPPRVFIPQINISLDSLPSPDHSIEQDHDEDHMMIAKKKTEPPLLQVRRPPLFDPFSIPSDLPRLSSWQPNLLSNFDVKTSTDLKTVPSDLTHLLHSRNGTFVSGRNGDPVYHDSITNTGPNHMSRSDSFSVQSIKMKPELQLYAHIRKGLCCGKKAEELFQKPS